MIYIVDNYNTTTAKELSIKFNCSSSFIGKVWMKNNLSGKLKNFYKLNDSYFNKINSPDKAYFLGLILSDGCIYTRNEECQSWVSLGLQEKDEHILQEFKQYLDYDKPLYSAKREIEKTRVISSMKVLQIVSDEMVNDLRSLGITERKTWNCDFPEIPSNLRRYMVRGFFDGDGGVSKTRGGINKSDYTLTFCGNTYTINYIENILTENNIKFAKVKCNPEKYSHDFYSINIFNTRSIYSFYTIFYKNGDNDNLKLKRKENLFNSFLNASQRCKTIGYNTKEA